MTEHRLSNDLSPALEAVLSSLNVNLEAELNRYRRTRHTQAVPEDDIFADLDAVIEASSNLNFDLAPAQPSIEIPAVTVATSDTPPPPPPRNKKLLAANSDLQLANQASNQASILAPASGHPDKPLATSPEINHHTPVSESLISEDLSSSAVVIKSPPSSGYLASSEKLIESLTDVPAMPEPINLNPEPRRKTVSLMAGAALGLLALIAGLGASYVMSNPDMAQTLAGGFNGEREATTSPPKRTFDPPGPDLSAQEFVNLKLDNLSSLNMQPRLDPLATAATPVSPALPPIASAAPPPIPQNILPSAPATPTQALSIPAGTNYYVTVPFSTEQGLIEIRKAVEEAFVRQFSDGNRIQLAVFDNPGTAQSFIANLQTQGVQAQIYGPTAE
ncbi:MAG: hypothetical protein AB8B99_07555 [Phormidesmis sp.]